MSGILKRKGYRVLPHRKGKDLVMLESLDAYVNDDEEYINELQDGTELFVKLADKLHIFHSKNVKEVKEFIIDRCNLGEWGDLHQQVYFDISIPVNTTAINDKYYSLIKKLLTHCGLRLRDVEVENIGNSHTLHIYYDNARCNFLLESRAADYKCRSCGFRCDYGEWDTDPGKESYDWL